MERLLVDNGISITALSQNKMNYGLLYDIGRDRYRRKILRLLFCKSVPRFCLPFILLTFAIL